jgi:hypothetical protein
MSTPAIEAARPASYASRAGEHCIDRIDIDRIDLCRAAKCLSQPTLRFGAPYIAESEDDTSQG